MRYENTIPKTSWHPLALDPSFLLTANLECVLDAIYDKSERAQSRFRGRRIQERHVIQILQPLQLDVHISLLPPLGSARTSRAAQSEKQLRERAVVARAVDGVGRVSVRAGEGCVYGGRLLEVRHRSGHVLASAWSKNVPAKCQGRSPRSSCTPRRLSYHRHPSPGPLST